jgi:hypothetical protein
MSGIFQTKNVLNTRASVEKQELYGRILMIEMSVADAGSKKG